MSLDGYRVVVSIDMAGMKKAVKVGGTIYVSPAMFDLMEHASPKELEHLLANIGLIDLGDPFDIADPFGMTTVPPRR